ncbi:hypothetical protein TYRP_012900 [Tyrophagus putrescentiae]|nr:hypothetical protein TYRP_012900 [Tyrophagus putrescentiae]
MSRFQVDGVLQRRPGVLRRPHRQDDGHLAAAVVEAGLRRPVPLSANRRQRLQLRKGRLGVVAVLHNVLRQKLAARLVSDSEMPVFMEAFSVGWRPRLVIGAMPVSDFPEEEFEEEEEGEEEEEELLVVAKDATE